MYALKLYFLKVLPWLFTQSLASEAHHDVVLPTELLYLVDEVSHRSLGGVLQSLTWPRTTLSFYAVIDYHSLGICGVILLSLLSLGQNDHVAML
jgi:hypothetical protein